MFWGKNLRPFRAYRGAFIKQWCGELKNRNFELECNYRPPKMHEIRLLRISATNNTISVAL